jgi:glycosyltransferase involved in cell wall biosynthesis
MKVCLLTRFFSLRNGGIGRFSMEVRSRLHNKNITIVPMETHMGGMVGLFIYSAFEIPLRLPRDCNIYHCMTPLEAVHVPKNKSIVTFHDLIPWLHLNEIETHYSSSSITGIASRNYFKFAAHRAAKCAAIVSNSEQTRREVIEYLGVPELKTSVIRFGIRPDLEPRSNKKNIFRVGTLSYLDKRKRIDLLIKAFLEANIDGELVIGGTGVDESRLKSLAGDDKRIKFLGFVADEKLVEFYNSLDYFIFPTKMEGYGLPIVEAFACKKPVVVLQDAVIPDEIKSKCIVVENLTEFLRGPVKSSNIESNYTFAKEHDWEKCVESYIKVYEKVASNFT